MWERVGTRLRQQVLRGARNPAVTLGVLRAQAAGCGHALDVATEGTLAGANPLSHRAARHHWVLFGAARMQTHKQIPTRVNYQQLNLQHKVPNRFRIFC